MQPIELRSSLAPLLAAACCAVAVAGCSTTGGGARIETQLDRCLAAADATPNRKQERNHCLWHNARNKWGN